MGEKQNENTLRIFTLCEELKELLGNKEAIADLKVLFERHSEDGMFDNMESVATIIDEVIKKTDYPRIVVENPKPQSDKDYIIGKQLNERKMGDVGIRNDEGTNVIFHANKRNIKQKEKQVLVEASSAETAPTRLDHYASKSNDLPMCDKALSTPTKEIISQNSDISQAQETTNLKQITKDTAVLTPQSSALLIKTYEQLGEEKLAHTLISTIETDKVTMQEVSKHYLALDNNTDELKAQLSKQQAHTQTLSEGAEQVGETAETKNDNKPKGPRQ